MSMEFGWWSKDADGKKFQVNVSVHGGQIEWTRKQGHHQSWITYGPPNDEDWEKLIGEAGKRVPRRLISPKQFEDLKNLRPH